MSYYPQLKVASFALHLIIYCYLLDRACHGHAERDRIRWNVIRQLIYRRNKRAWNLKQHYIYLAPSRLRVASSRVLLGVTAQIQEIGNSSRLPNYENSKLKRKERKSRSAHDFGDTNTRSLRVTH
jgi:hypothetical protein